MILKSGQAGSAVMYVLIGVVLFAALGFAMSHMMRGSAGGKGQEIGNLAATTVIQYADTVRGAVRAMQIGGVSENALCFDSPNWGNAHYTYAACSNTANMVFDNAGGGVQWEASATDINDGSPWLFTGANGIDGIGTTCGTAGCADLKMILPNVHKTVCLAIDAQLGIPTPNDTPPVDTGYDTAYFVGSYTSTATGDIGDEAGSAGLSGKPQGCFASSSSPAAGQYHYYRVLLSR